MEKGKEYFLNLWHQYGKRLFPYGLIFFALLSIYLFWDGNSLWENKTVSVTSNVEEEKRDLDQNEDQDMASAESNIQLVYSTEKAVRYKDIPDLLATTASLTAIENNSDMEPTEGEGTERDVQAIALPMIRGFMKQKNMPIVLLQYQNKVQACQVGDVIGSYTVLYIHENCVGIGDKGQVWEIKG